MGDSLLAEKEELEQIDVFEEEELVLGGGGDDAPEDDFDLESLFD